MVQEQDGRSVVRAALRREAAGLQRLRSSANAWGFDRSLRSMRRLAEAYRFDAVVRLADAYQHLPQTARGCRSGALLLDRLDDAIACDMNPAATEALVASISVRFEGF
jgi:hypothetical protein